jgi:YesN/AraC family two-component response regulator
VLLYCAGLFFVKKLSSRKPTVIAYEKLNISNYSDENLKKVAETIAVEYRDRALTLDKLANRIGMSPVKISSVIQDRFSMSFKEYLNSIRLSEAKRLIIETDRQVSEIAFTVGYHSLTHFYRVFKAMFRVSPNEFRKANTKNSDS